MKHIERISDEQRTRASKRFKTRGSQPYWGPLEIGQLLIDGHALMRRIPLKFNPPIYAEWRRW
jgi:hypothetical protein